MLDIVSGYNLSFTDDYLREWRVLGPGEREKGDGAVTLARNRHLTLWVVLVAGFFSTASGAALAEHPPDPGVTQSFVLGSGATANPYIVYTPTTYDPSKPAPLLVMAHGLSLIHI